MLPEMRRAQIAPIESVLYDGKKNSRPRLPLSGSEAGKVSEARSSVDDLGQANALGAAALQQGRDIGADALGKVLQRHEPSAGEAQAVAIEAGLALREDGFRLRADAVGRLH